MIDILIIGGGPSGVMSGLKIRDKDPNKKVVIIEKDSKILKRILLSGNGRCNIFNYFIKPEEYNNKEFIKNLLPEFTAVWKYLKSAGFEEYIDEEGRIYPLTEFSKTVYDFFLTLVKEKGIDVVVEEEILKIEKKVDSYILHGTKKTYEAKKIVFATGGVSYDRDIKKWHSLVDSLQVKVSSLRPSLCPLVVKEKISKSLIGSKFRCVVTLYENEKVIARENGSVLFKKNEISGIVIFNMAAKITSSEKHSLSLKFIEKEALLLRAKKLKIYDIDRLSFGYLDQTLIDYLKERFALKNDDIEHFDMYLENLPFIITGFADFKDSQVTRGGIEVSEISERFSLRKDENIFIAGEVLNIDGKCGGFNLAFALASGYKVGEEV